MEKKFNIAAMFNIILGIIVVAISAYINIKNNNLKMILFVLAGIFFMLYGIVRLKK